MERKKALQVIFFETKNQKQPVRDFILSLAQNDRKIIGSDIFVVQKTFPLGFPLVRKMGNNLWEIRSTISQGIVSLRCKLDYLRVRIMRTTNNFFGCSNILQKLL